MEADQLGVMMCIIVPVAAFAMIFGIVYLRNREKMAMIERGMDPRSYKPKVQTAPYQTLKWGLLLSGAGLGLLISVILVTTCLANMDDDAKPGIFFGMIAFFGGLGLIASFFAEKRDNAEETTKAID